MYIEQIGKILEQFYYQTKLIAKIKYHFNTLFQ